MPQASSAAAISTTGNTTSFTVVQPKLANSMPEENEPTAMDPNTRKSLKACTLLRSVARWHAVTMVVAPMKAKFHPTPSSVSPIQKCQSESPEIPIAAATNRRPSPRPAMRSTPKRTMSAPVTKLGAYMPSTCHCRPSVASVIEWLHMTMASGAEVMTMFIIE